MIEVFKTNVNDLHHANKLIFGMQKVFSNYEANFDLEDCDKILRVKCSTELIQAQPVIEFINSFGFYAEVLPDS